MSSSALVLYVSKDGRTEVRLFDDRGMLKQEAPVELVKHVTVYASKCSVDVSIAEFETAVIIRISGNTIYEQKNNVLEVRCVGD
ncbi:MAG: hypothetical protein QW504_00225 [Sulfolobales archaeon]